MKEASSYEQKKRQIKMPVVLKKGQQKIIVDLMLALFCLPNPANGFL